MSDHVEPWLFLAPVLGVASAMIVIRARRRARESQAWPVAKGIITESVVMKGGRGGDIALITYLYFTPEQRAGRGVGPGGALVSNPAGLVKRFPKGTEVLIRYNPANPGDSFLDSGSQVQLPALTLLAVLGIAFPLVYFLWVNLLK